MKRIFAIAAIAAAMLSCGDTTGYMETTPAEKLVMHMEMLVDADKIMYGHQDDLMYGHSWKIEDGAKEFVKSDVKDVCGAYPGVYGMDLGGIELSWEANLDKNDFL